MVKQAEKSTIKFPSGERSEKASEDFEVVWLLITCAEKILAHPD